MFLPRTKPIVILCVFLRVGSLRETTFRFTRERITDVERFDGKRSDGCAI